MVFSSAHLAQVPRHMVFHTRTPPRLSRQLPPALPPVACHCASPKLAVPHSELAISPSTGVSFRSFCKHMLV